MAYQYAKISPSSLAYAERCAGFRPDGEENQAAVDGTVFHDCMFEMVATVPQDQWESWIATRQASPATLGLMEAATQSVRSLPIAGLPSYPNFRMRLVRGNPRKSRLKPGLYPECELERGQGRHGYIDLMVVTEPGLVYIVDYKSNRVGKDFSWQIGAYAVDVNRLCPAHDTFVCQIIAPRLDDDEQLKVDVGPVELETLRDRIAAIEKRADDACNDGEVERCPGDQCEHCHWSGRCRAQAAATKTVGESVSNDIVLVSEKTGKETVVQSFRSLTGPRGPYCGERITEETFTRPSTYAQRGLRRACLKFLEILVERAKDNDKKWAKDYSPDQLKTIVPGYTVSWRNGRGSVDSSRMADITRDVMSRYGLTMDEIVSVSDINKDRLVEMLTLRGGKKTTVTKELDKLYEPYTTQGSPVLYWTQKPVSTKTAIEAEFTEAK